MQVLSRGDPGARAAARAGARRAQRRRPDPHPDARRPRDARPGRGARRAHRDRGPRAGRPALRLRGASTTARRCAKRRAPHLRWGTGGSSTSCATRACRRRGGASRVRAGDGGSARRRTARCSSGTLPTTSFGAQVERALALAQAVRPRSSRATAESPCRSCASCMDLGMRWPDDVSLLAFDEPVWAPILSPALAVVRHPTARYRAGGVAAHRPAAARAARRAEAHHARSATRARRVARARRRP